MTDLTSIGTLFAFVLVSGGVLVLPRVAKEKGKFNLPYINAKLIFPAIYILTIVVFFSRITNGISQISTEGYQEILFIIFIILSGILAIFTFFRNYSLIPVLGVYCCLYLMVEIPANSWMVFFGWMGFGLLLYFIYGRKHSKLNQ
jgi:hypothetical protein